MHAACQTRVLATSLSHRARLSRRTLIVASRLLTYLQRCYRLGFGLLLACGLLVGALAGGCTPQVRDQKSVIVIVIDTLRRDKLGIYGNARGLTPQLDALASQALVCDDAWAHAPWTLPSTASLLSGVLPQRHGAGGDVSSGFRAVREDTPLLAEQFRAHGWRTGLIANVDFLGPAFGLTRGFEHVDALGSRDNHTPRTATRTTQDALRFVEGCGDQPFFLVLHYFDVHAEYEPPQPWRARFADPRDAAERTQPMGSREQVVARRFQGATLDADLLGRMERLYDAEVAYVDDAIGAFWRGLPEQVRATCTLVVTSDHGEEFGEHGDWEHGHTHHPEVLRVPLFLRAPDLSPRRETALVGHVDVARTLLARAGLDEQRARDGQRLDTAPLPGDTQHHTAFGRFWGPATTSMRSERYAVHRRASPQAPLLYERPADAWEAQPVRNEARLQGALVSLAAWEAEQELLPAKQGPTPRMDASTKQRLDGVGYVEAPR